MSSAGQFRAPVVPRLVQGQYTMFSVGPQHFPPVGCISRNILFDLHKEVGTLKLELAQE